MYRYEKTGLYNLMALILFLPSLVNAQDYYATNINPDKQTPISTIYLMPNVYPAVVMEETLLLVCG